MMQTTSVRITSGQGRGLVRLLGGDAPLSQWHTELTRLIGQHLSPVTAAMLARPEDATSVVTWSTELSGEPVPLARLDASARRQVRDRLQNRRAAIERLADALPRLTADDAGLADALHAAAQMPDENSVYAVDGEPVVIWWGHRRRGPAQRYLAGRARRPGFLGPASPRLVRTPFLVAFLLALMLAGGLFWWERHNAQQTRELSAAVDNALADVCRSRERIGGLLERLHQRDPTRKRYPGLWRRLLDEQQRCARAAALQVRFAESMDDCDAMAALQTTLADHDNTREPLRSLVVAVDAKLAQCRQAKALLARVAAARGDCAKIAELLASVQVGADLLPALDAALAALNDEALLCASAEALGQAVADADGDCARLLQIDGQLRELPTEREPLRPIAAAVAIALDHCATADAVRADIDAAQMDCRLIARLDAHPALVDPAAPSIAAQRIRLDGQLAICAGIADLAGHFESVRQNCAALTAFADGLQARADSHPDLIALRERVATEIALCERAAALAALLQTRRGTCNGLGELRTEIAGLPADDPRFRVLRASLQDEMALCAAAARLAAEYKAAGDDCKRLHKLRQGLSAGQVRAPHFAAVVAALERGIEACQKTEQQCPGERKLPPEMAIVFDASSSMETPLAGVLARFAGMRTNLDVAKETTRTIVQGAPSDVNIGLVQVSGCPHATNLGKFKPSQRAALLRRIDAISAGGTTPLASGIAAAANQLDGVRKPAVMLVISDGKDSCLGADAPCHIARELAQRKPRLKVNVVDIGGTGAANCVATATGGKVYAAADASGLQQALRNAARPLQVPAHCRP